MKLPHPQGLPATIASTRVRMDTHSKEVHAGRTKRLYNTDAKEKHGAECRIRTDDLQITKLSLYQLCQLSYSSMVVTVTSSLVPSVVQHIAHAQKRI